MSRYINKTVAGSPDFRVQSNNGKVADSYIPEDVVRANNGLDIDSMNEKNEVVNIFILS